MCSFAKSTDKFRFGESEFTGLINRAVDAGVKFVRFTGGEPLMHRELLLMIRRGADADLRVSLITNGFLLPRMAADLADAGLSHIVVSIDGATAASHDESRNMRHSFDHAVEGIGKMVDLGVPVRVNTVVGPHNYREIPDLQRLLGDIGVSQWELSALKLADMPPYDNPADVMAVGDQVYTGGGLVPLGKRWYGDTREEQERYFQFGTPPRVSGPMCFAATDVMYLDAKNSMMYPCSCLAHRGNLDFGTPFPADRQDLPLVSSDFAKIQQHFAEHGPSMCTGCSATAAGYSQIVENNADVPDWAY